MNVTTLSTHKTEGGLVLKFQEKKVSGEHTSYQILSLGRRLGDAGLVFAGGTYAQACDCLDWWLAGCPA